MRVGYLMLFDYKGMIPLKSIAVAHCFLMLIPISACKPTASKSTERHQEALKNMVVVDQFDSDRSTISNLIDAINKVASEGAADVRFPTGEWHWYCPHCARNEWNDLPKKETLANIEVRADSLTTEELSKWLTANQIRGVSLSIDPNQPAEMFFRLEKVLRERGIKYWVSSDAPPGGIVIEETYQDYSTSPNNQEIEQAAPSNGDKPPN
jgi:hypothetical protein